MATDRRIIRGTSAQLFAAVDDGRVLEGNLLHDETTGITYYAGGSPNTPTTRALLQVVHDPTLASAQPLQFLGENERGLIVAWDDADTRVQETTTTVDGVSYPTLSVTYEVPDGN